MSLVLILALAVVVLIFVVGVGALVLIKLGVIAHYALKDEPREDGDYRLSQSRELGRE